jgi:hypothetical protein
VPEPERADAPIGEVGASLQSVIGRDWTVFGLRLSRL